MAQFNTFFISVTVGLEAKTNLCTQNSRATNNKRSCYWKDGSLVYLQSRSIITSQVFAGGHVIQLKWIFLHLIVGTSQN